MAALGGSVNPLPPLRTSMIQVSSYAVLGMANAIARPRSIQSSEIKWGRHLASAIILMAMILYGFRHNISAHTPGGSLA